MTDYYDEWIKYFPFKEPRPQQIEAINFAFNVFKSGTKYCLLNAPCGGGKSAVAVTLARYYKDYPINSSISSAYIITTQRILQEQYKKDFSDLCNIWAKKNYVCPHRFGGMTCDFGLKIEKALNKKNFESYFSNCEYVIDKRKFDKSDIGLTNLHFFLSHSSIRNRDLALKERNLIVIDECIRGDAKILIDSGETVSMKHLYMNPTINYVMSFNEKENKYEKKRILKKIKSEYNNNTVWYEIILEYNGKKTKLLVTDNHKVYTLNRGYVRADELSNDDILKYDTSKKTNYFKCLHCDKKFNNNAPIHSKSSKITNLEQFIIGLYLDNVKYTGNGKFWLTFKNGKYKNPDFKIKKEKKVIEIGHTYWHTENEINETIKNYNEIGFECLYITEKDIKNDISETINKIFKFVYNHDIKIKSIRKLQQLNGIKNKLFKYNIEVEDNHNYFANDILISNCHNLENVVVSYASLQFTKYFCEEVLKLKWSINSRMTFTAFIEWMKNTYVPRLLSEYASYKSQLELANTESFLTSNSGMSLMRKVDELEKQSESVTQCLNVINEDEWVLSISATEDLVTVSPLYPKNYTRPLIFDLANKVLLMSGTILDKKTYCNNIGIPENDAEFISLDSPFKKENRPIFIVNVGSLSRNNIDKTLPNVVHAIKELLDEHKNEKGIVHCGTYIISRYIEQHIDSDRLLFHSTDDRQNILDFHLMSKEPTVLVSPSFTEGVDLYDDLSRFQIIVKMPFGYLGDNYIRTKMEKIPGWYEYVTAKTLIQASGRSVRNVDDHCCTYILDSDMVWWYDKNNYLFPKWWKDAIQK